ncbi:MAG: beta-glucuronidase [Clostridia bacterium]|nr:beta-glucuronidase [Clostridia bacterium]
MDRLFNTNNIREKFSLDGMWDLYIDGKGDFRTPVPGCWEQIPSLASFKGNGTYKQKVKIEKSSNLRLTFKGVSHTADVYFDGEKIAHHYNAYTPFSAVVKNAEAGEHELKVEVDNTFGEHSALHVPNDYYTYGGITRPVTLEYIPDCFIEYVHFTPILTDDKWYAKIEACVSNISDNDFGGKIVSRLGENEVIMNVNVLANSKVTVSAEAQFKGVLEWNEKEPNLYLLDTVLYENNYAIDDLIERVGFRTVKVEGKKIYLNNKEIYFKGFNRHEDHPTFGCAIPIQLMAHDMQLMLDTGANAVRTSHYPNDERFLDMCDERGVLVWEENHARGLNLQQMQNVNFDKQCEDCIDEMVLYHYNHPSIVIWGILNECASDEPKGREKFKKQFEQLRSLDASRPKSFATCRHFTDICLDLPDILSVNLYPLWYDDSEPIEQLEKEKKWMEEAAGCDKPFLITEYGAGAVYGYRSDTCARWTEERQKEILDDVIGKYMERDDLNGIFLWQFCDCRVTEEHWFKTRPKTINNKGIVDGYRRKKLAYQTVKKHYSKQK